MVFVIFRHKILHDAAAFEEADRFAIRELVRQCWNAAIGVNIEEPLLLLCILGDVDLGELVWQAEGA